MKHLLHLVPIALAVTGLSPTLQSCSQDEPYISTEEAPIITQGVSPRVTKSEAVNVALNFGRMTLGHDKKLENRATPKVEYLNNRLGEPVAYVVNTEGEGWTIVSATRNFYPVIAYSDEPSATFSTSATALNEGIMMWLDEVSPAITRQATDIDEETRSEIAAQWDQLAVDASAVQSSGLPTGNSPEAVACRARIKELNETYYKDGWSFTTLPNITIAALKSHISDVADQYDSPYEYTIVGLKDDPSRINVGPLVQTTWHQESPYNDLCPDNSLAGCVAIAMAQIMNFHRIPASYNWSEMMNTDASYDCKRLIRDIGTAVNMIYGSSISTTTFGFALDGFSKFGYGTTYGVHNSDDVIEEIVTERRPVFMSGLPDVGYGHAWVCDGVHRNKDASLYYVEYINSVNEYSNKGETFIYNPGTFGGSRYTEFHMNWGWKSANTVGWYVSINSEGTAYIYDRMNIYVSHN